MLRNFFIFVSISKFNFISNFNFNFVSLLLLKLSFPRSLAAFGSLQPVIIIAAAN